MKKRLRMLFGALIICGGVTMVVFSLSLLPHPFRWSGLFQIFLPFFIVSIGIVISGWSIVAGKKWRYVVAGLLSALAH